MRVKYVTFSTISPHDITVDVRSKEEFEKQKRLTYNVPIMSEHEHQEMKRYIYFAIFIILYRLFQNRREIEEKIRGILENHPTGTLIIGCSRGRLRSPLTAIYLAVKLNRRVYIIKDGVKYIGEAPVGFFRKWFEV